MEDLGKTAINIVVGLKYVEHQQQTNKTRKNREDCVLYHI